MENKKNQPDSDTRNDQETEFPGYPHYPGKDDITRAQNNNGKETLNEENISLPDVSDIPGQEHINPAPIGQLADATASSADEEGIVSGSGLDNDDTRIVMGTEADVTPEDLQLLEAADQNMDTVDDVNMLHASLDDVDEDGELLNEQSLDRNVTGSDLDIPGSDLDDNEELLGEEDEENNYYSLGGDNHESQEENNGDQ